MEIIDGILALAAMDKFEEYMNSHPKTNGLSHISKVCRQIIDAHDEGIIVSGDCPLVVVDKARYLRDRAELLSALDEPRGSHTQYKRDARIASRRLGR